MEEQQQDNPTTSSPTTSSSAQCSECGTEVPADAPLGLCPACLLKRAMLATTAGLNRGSVGGGFEPPSVAELKPLFPHLEILELIGRGGMGAVYKAVQIHLDRFVAIKILPTTIADDPAFAERFAREARSLARLNHANIVTVHDFGRAGPYFFFVMEFVDGANLRQALLTKSLEPKQALAIVPQICDALQYAHDEGIVHRDIKPENVLLDKKGRVKIADFGLAKLLQKTPQNYTLTQTHVTMGTPQYMAPEQTERPTEVDHRADIYSLGVVFYEMLTGELPLGRFAAPSQKAPVDVRLDDVVFKTLEKEPARRYQHANEVKTSVQELSSAPTRPTTPGGEPGADGAAATGANERDAQAVLPYARPASAPTSRPAVVGAIFGALGIGSLMLSMIAGAFIGGDRELTAIVVLPLVLFAVASFITMTVCGLFGISHIRQSRGQLGGLRLALFDAVAFPIVVSNAIVLMGMAVMLYFSVRLGLAEAFALFSVLGFPLCVVADFFLVRYLWRRVSAGTPDEGLLDPARRRRAPEPPQPAMSGITYQGPGRFSRTAIAGAIWGSLAVLGPACLLVASIALPGSRGGAPAAVMLTGKNITVTTPVRPVAPATPPLPGRPSQTRGLTPSTTPPASITHPQNPRVPGAVGASGGGGSFGATAGTLNRGRPTTKPSANASTLAPLTPGIETTTERVAEARYQLERTTATTQRAASALAFVSPTTAPVVLSDEPFTIVASSGGGGSGGTMSSALTVSPRAGSNPNPFAPVFTTTPVRRSSSFWDQITDLGRGLVFPVLALAVSAPIGATILGIIAISQIRRSNGAVYGMPLAVADALFFPLLVVDGLIIAFVVGLFIAIATRYAALAMLAPVGAATIAAVLVLDWLIWRRAVRAAEAL